MLFYDILKICVLEYIGRSIHWSKEGYPANGIDMEKEAYSGLREIIAITSIKKINATV